MSYAMTHLIIADQFAKNRKIKEKELFLLASIAPDAVHARPDFQKELKVKSHFMQEGVKWGEIYKEKEMKDWYDELRQFYLDRADYALSEKEMAFLQGYTVHILVDIFNCQLLYAPNLIQYGLNIEKFREDYRSECVVWDNYLYHTYEESTYLMCSMEKALQEKLSDELLSRLRLDQEISVKNIEDNTRFQMNLFRNSEKEKIDSLYMVTQENSDYFLKYVEEQCEKLLFSFPKIGNLFATEYEE